VRRGGKVYLVGQTGDLGSRCGGLDPHPAIFSDLLTSRSTEDSRGRVTVRTRLESLASIAPTPFSRSIDIDTLAIDRGMSGARYSFFSGRIPSRLSIVRQSIWPWV
jgi:hypothetical protein